MTTPQDATPNLLTQPQRLAQEQARLQAEWALRDEKLGVLRQAWAIEAYAEPKFQLQQQIQAEEAELAGLTAQLTALEAELSPVRAPNNLPYRGARYFVGRDEDLDRLHEQLQTAGPIAITAIAGMGGVGKTELALQYARKHCCEGAYPGSLVWMRAREDVGAQIISFVRSSLDLTPPEDLELVEKVRWGWGRWPAGDALLIFDDVQQYEDIAPFLPPQDSRFKVLLTTRSRFGSPVQDFPLDVLSEAQALELLRALVSDWQRSATSSRSRRSGNRETALCLVGLFALGRGVSGPIFIQETGLVDRWIVATVASPTLSRARLSASRTRHDRILRRGRRL